MSVVITRLSWPECAPMKQHASAIWNGSLKEGHGVISTGSGALTAKPYSFRTRFEGEPGTNPEELIGTAHASCFSMALSMMLVIQEQIFVSAVRCKRHRCNTQAWKATLKSIPSRERSCVSPCLSER